jgi:hypothetical protein
LRVGNGWKADLRRQMLTASVAPISDPPTLTSKRGGSTLSSHFYWLIQVPFHREKTRVISPYPAAYGIRGCCRCRKRDRR